MIIMIKKLCFTLMLISTLSFAASKKHVIEENIEFGQAKRLWHDHRTQKSTEGQRKLIAIAQKSKHIHQYEAIQLLWSTYNFGNIYVAATCLEKIGFDLDNPKAMEASILLWQNWNAIHYHKGASLLNNFIEKGNHQQRIDAAKLLLNSCFGKNRIQALLKINNFLRKKEEGSFEKTELQKIFDEHLLLEIFYNSGFMGIQNTENGSIAKMRNVYTIFY